MIEYTSNRKPVNKMINQRAGVIIVLMVVCMALLLVKLVYLQVIKHDLYTTKSEKNHVTVILVESTRGMVYDRNGIVLANNLPRFSLNIIPELIDDLSQTVAVLKKVMPVSDEDIASYKQAVKQRRRYQSIVLKPNLTEEEIARYSLNQYHIKGTVIQPHMYRHYPEGEYFSHVLGHTGRLSQGDFARINANNYTSNDSVGKTGLERQLEERLHGKIGYKRVEVNASGDVVRAIDSVPPVAGQDVTLTIDAKLQKIAHDALAGYEGAIVALDAKTSGVLALVSQPSFDANQFVTGISHKQYQRLMSDSSKPMFNRALNGSYAPGSTIKPFFAWGALDRKVVSTRTTYKDPGWFKLPDSDRIYRDWNMDRGGHGRVDVRTALIVSCDTFFYRIAHAMGIDMLAAVLRQFHFGETTGIELPHESQGLVPTPGWKRQEKGKSWYTGDSIITGIGQGYLLATPLQLARATMLLANHGQEQPVTLLLENTNKQLVAQSTVIASESSIWGVIDKALMGVINSTKPWGTGGAFGRNPPYTVAAKTGTAQVTAIRMDDDGKKIKQEDLAKKLRDNALFIAYSPVKTPEIVVVVVVEHQPTSKAARIARKVTDSYYKPKRQGSTDA